jgi:hypothetical protein
MEKVLLSTAVKNAVKKSFKGNPDNLEFSLDNIIINGDKRGCSGFITNRDNGVTVFLDTEKCVCGGSMFCRYALNDKDYTGCRNRNIYTKDELIEEVCKCLADAKDYQLELSLYKKIV